MREPRTSYNGPAELWVDGAMWRQDIAVRLTGYVEVIQVKTIGAVTRMDGVTWWDGYLSGLAWSEQIRLVGKLLELRLASGAICRGILTGDGDGYLSGYGMSPF
jgi:hypothetical protein